METTIKIKLSTGKEIELTENEHEEIKRKYSIKELIYVPYVQKEFPVYPTYPQNPWDWNKVWCSDSSDTLEWSRSIGKKVRFMNMYADSITCKGVDEN